MSVPGFVAADGGFLDNQEANPSWGVGLVSPGTVGSNIFSVQSRVVQPPGGRIGVATADLLAYTVPAGKLNNKYMVRAWLQAYRDSTVDDKLVGLWEGYFSADSAGLVRFDDDNQSGLTVVGAGITVTGSVSGQALRCSITNAATNLTIMAYMSAFQLVALNVLP